MVTVYFESDCHAEVVAEIAEEWLYDLLVPVLEAAAEEHGMRLTESIDSEELTKKEHL